MTAEPREKRMTTRDLQAAERKEQILAVAGGLFAEKGYHATSMRELNKAIGMAEALTYHYFPGGKLEILHAVLQRAQEERMSRIGRFLDETFQTGRPLGEVLLKLIVGLTEQVQQDQHYFKILFQERNLLAQEHKDMLDTMTQQPFAAMAAYLDTLAAADQIRPMDHMLAASQFLSHIVMRIVKQLLKSRTLEPEEAEQLVGFYMQLWGK